MSDSDSNDNLMNMTADIVSAHVSHNNVAVGDVPNLIQSVFASMRNLLNPAAPEPAKLEPAVSVRASVKPDHIVCLEDGKKLKMLKRHLMTHYGLSPDEYRKKWGLSTDYPMVAPNYAEQRRALAKKIGLGTKRGRAPSARTRNPRPAGTGAAAGR